MEIAYVHDETEFRENHFPLRAFKLFSAVKVRRIHISDFTYADIDKYDLFFVHVDSFYASEKPSILRDIHPAFLINGRVIHTSKPFISETYERIYGNRLTLYRRDIAAPPECHVFRKPLGHVDCGYEMTDLAHFGDGKLNQVMLQRHPDVWGLFFMDKEPLALWRAKGRIFPDKALQIESVWNVTEARNFIKTIGQEKFWEMTRACGIDFGRADIIVEARVPYIIDMNTHPRFPETHPDIDQQMADAFEKIIFNRIADTHVHIHGNIPKQSQRNFPSV